ncbi:MAG: molybdenum cofactor guanylyltransferase MobA [Rhodocyclaceae bacterium]
MTQSKVAGLILAGGQGSRMGGVDKGLVELDGRPLVAHVIERLGPQVDTLIINANRNAEAYAGFGLPVLADRSGGFVGPLAGLDAALAAPPPGARWIVTCPCDSPFLPLDLVGRLLAAAEAENAELAMPIAEGQFQPVFLLARSDVAESLAAYLAADGRKIDRWVRSRPHVIVDFEDCVEAFANINTAEELARHHGAAAVPRRR